MPTEQAIEAHPRTPDNVARLPQRPEVVVAAEERGIRDVVHFTTTNGAVGVLASRAVKSRTRLPKDKYLEHVYRPNAELRKDQAWFDYVNLSISRINDWMFDASTRWHAADGNPWVVLSFAPCILGHPGVIFTTTNNIYPACRRAEGLSGFSRLFANSVRGRYNELHDRTDKEPAWTTDRQAEVLYPGELSCTYLQRIDVQQEETVDLIHGMMGVFGMSVPVRHAPEVFE